MDDDGYYSDEYKAAINNQLRVLEAIKSFDPGDRVMLYFYSGTRWCGRFDGVVQHRSSGRCIMLVDASSVFLGMFSATSERAVAVIDSLAMIELCE
jgi:hypothetical protein